MSLEEIVAKFLKSFVSLYTNYGWQGLALAVSTCIACIPLNALIKLIFSKVTSTFGVRVRKALSICSVFAVGVGAFYVYYLYFVGVPFDIFAQVGELFDLGISAMVCWWVIKLVRDVGFGALIDYCKKNKDIVSTLKSLKIDTTVSKQVLETITTLTKKYAKESKQTVEEWYENNASVVSTRVWNLLKANGLENEEINSNINKFLSIVKTKLNIKED